MWIPILNFTPKASNLNYKSVNAAPLNQDLPKFDHLIFEDIFAKDRTLNPKDWTFQNGFVRNKELQWYQPQNASIEGGHLVIEARHETVPNSNFVPGSKSWKTNRANAEYTSSCIYTKGLHSWLYGRFEFKAKFNPELGNWPAIWFLGTSRKWPHCGEVDLLEYYQHTLLSNACWANGTWSTAKTPIDTLISTDPKWTQKFHIWRMDWTSSWIKLYVDNRLENAIDLSKTADVDGYNPFHHPMYLLMNLAIGATGGNPSGIQFPSKFEIDWVKIYQQS